MRNSLSHGFGGSSHWLDMLGGALSEGQSKRGGANPDAATRSTDRLGVSAHRVRRDRTGGSIGGGYSLQ